MAVSSVSRPPSSSCSEGRLLDRPPSAGVRACRDAIGARLTARVGSSTIVRAVDGGGGYISAGDPRVHFGIGDATRVDRLEVRWPCPRDASSPAPICR